MVAPLANAKEESKEWINLCEDNSTKGWTPRAKVESFESVDGELNLLSKVNVWVLSDLQMKDFVVEGEVKIPLDYEGFNSGLGFRLVGDQGKPKGYQCEIDQKKPAAIYGIGLGAGFIPERVPKQSIPRESKDCLMQTHGITFGFAALVPKPRLS